MQNNKKEYEAEKHIYQLKEMAMFSDENNDFSKTILYENFRVLKEIALLKGVLREDRKNRVNIF